MPSEVESIRGSESRLLWGVKVGLLVTGGISIYRVPDLARGLIRHGAYVDVYMTREASRLISPKIFKWATGGRVFTRLSGYAEHVSLCPSYDIIVVAPATANTIGKVANGVADNPVTLCLMAAMGAGKPIIMAPAMNINMWLSPILGENIGKLRRLGVTVLEPRIEEGKAKLPDVDEVVEAAIDALAPRDLKGLRILITSGPTREHVDDVKYLTTPSSGLTGYYIAREALARGASVVVVSGPVGLKYPKGVEVINVEGVLEMRDAVMDIVRRGIDVAIFSAAPLDYYVAERYPGKLPSDLDSISVKLVRAPKIVSEVKKTSPGTIVVGFKAEVNVSDDELVKRALERMREGSWDLAIAHDVGRGLGFSTIKDDVIVIRSDGSYFKTGPIHKRELARVILNEVSKLARHG